IHTIVTDWCTGCELCGLVCPTDCITFLVRSSEKRKLFKEEAAQRFFNKQIRVEKLRKIEEKSSVFINVDDRSKKELLKTLVDTI
ncbi:MAG: 4Fe-4S binding protein, partial [Pseudomonadota bacterium]|nr:4Fe-4S binding protein [Pseudomonadota bacterium]